VASADGVSRFSQGNWVQNGTAEGLNTNAVEMLFEDSHGVLWAGAKQCWQTFHPEADADPPRTLIVPSAGTKQNTPEDGAITLNFRGADKWQITPPPRLLFSHRLDEGEWSAFDSETNVTLSDLPFGKHYFQVRAMDRAGNVEPEPAHWEFAVVLPWYEESRLVLIAALGAGAALFFAGLAYKRHRQLQRSYVQVEQQVAERTRELEMASRELLQSQKMRALGTLAAGIAHDFNNILSIIKGSAQIIEDNPGNAEKIRTRTSRIKTVVDQGSAVVQAMLGFSRSGDDLLEPCPLNSLVENTIKLLGDRFLREVEIQFDSAPALPPARVSSSLVQQILLNFIFNAAESMEGRKRIVIATALAVPWSAGTVLPPGPAEGYVSVSVRDSGSGIEPENLPRVFEPFFTTKALSTRRGTGLGLSIAYELAKKMEAGLAVESAPGKGSVFSLILPVAVAEKSVPGKTS
jgi:signal transduction histidine kinase